MPWIRRDLALLCGALAVTGCQEGNQGDEPTRAAPEATCEGSYDSFEVGMSKLAEPGRVSITLQAAEPSPPAVRDDNVWTLQVLDAEGEALSGARLVVSPYMPKHQHGSAEVVVKDLGDGAYRLSAIELVMPGVWEVPITITPPEGEPSEAAFSLCILDE